MSCRSPKYIIKSWRTTGVARQNQMYRPASAEARGLRDTRITASTTPRTIPRIIARRAMYSVSRRARRIMGSNRKSQTVSKSNRTARSVPIFRCRAPYAAALEAPRPEGRPVSPAAWLLVQRRRLQVPLLKDLVVLPAVLHRLQGLFQSSLERRGLLAPTHAPNLQIC